MDNPKKKEEMEQKKPLEQQFETRLKLLQLLLNGFKFWIPIGILDCFSILCDLVLATTTEDSQIKMSILNKMTCTSDSLFKIFCEVVENGYLDITVVWHESGNLAKFDIFNLDSFRFVISRCQISHHRQTGFPPSQGKDLSNNGCNKKVRGANDHISQY